MQKSIQTLSVAVGDGGNNHLNGAVSVLELKNIKNYLTADFCISCPYFKQTKGNFGLCSVISNKKPYDGTKIGSGCSCWRLRSDLYDLKFQQTKKTKEPELKTVDKYDLLIEDYNEEKKQGRVEKLHEWKENPEILKKFTGFRHSLPYAQTSDVLVKRAVFHKHKSKKTIKTVLKLYDQGMSFVEIKKAMYYMSIPIGLNTIINYCTHFMDYKPTPLNFENIVGVFGKFWNMVALENNLCIYCSSNKTIRRGRLDTGGMFCYCKNCHSKFTTRINFTKKRTDPKIISYAVTMQHTQGLSSRQIVTAIQKKFHKNVSCQTILQWIKQYSPDYTFYKNASHRPDIQLKISSSLQGRKRLRRFA